MENAWSEVDGSERQVMIEKIKTSLIIENLHIKDKYSNNKIDMIAFRVTYLSAAGVMVLMAAVKSSSLSTAFSIFSCRKYVVFVVA